MKEQFREIQPSNPCSRRKKKLLRIKRSHSSVVSISISGLTHMDCGLVGTITIYIICGCSTDFNVKNKYILKLFVPNKHPQIIVATAI